MKNEEGEHYMENRVSQLRYFSNIAGYNGVCNKKFTFSFTLVKCLILEYIIINIDQSMFFIGYYSLKYIKKSMQK